MQLLYLVLALLFPVAILIAGLRFGEWQSNRRVKQLSHVSQAFGIRLRRNVLLSDFRSQLPIGAKLPVSSTGFSREYLPIVGEGSTQNFNFLFVEGHRREWVADGKVSSGDGPPDWIWVLVIPEFVADDLDYVIYPPAMLRSGWDWVTGRRVVLDDSPRSDQFRGEYSVSSSDPEAVRELLSDKVQTIISQDSGWTIVKNGNALVIWDDNLKKRDVSELKPFIARCSEIATSLSAHKPA